MTDHVFLSLLIRGSNMAALVAILFTVLLLGKSLRDFSQTGPPLAKEVLRNYRSVLALSLARLGLAAFLLANLLALPGVLAYLVGLAVLGLPYDRTVAALAALISLGLLFIFQFCRILHDSPGVIVASSHYAMPRFYPLWDRLSAARLATAASTAWRTSGLPHRGMSNLSTPVRDDRSAAKTTAPILGARNGSEVTLDLRAIPDS